MMKETPFARQLYYLEKYGRDMVVCGASPSVKPLLEVQQARLPRPAAGRWWTSSNIKKLVLLAKLGYSTVVRWTP